MAAAPIGRPGCPELAGLHRIGGEKADRVDRQRVEIDDALFLPVVAPT